MKRILECWLRRDRLNGAMFICNYMSVTQCQTHNETINKTKAVRIYNLPRCQEMSASSIIQESIVQQACPVVSSTDVITTIGPTHLFPVTTQPNSSFVSSQNIKTKHFLLTQGDNLIQPKKMRHPSKRPTPTFKTFSLVIWL